MSLLEFLLFLIALLLFFAVVLLSWNLWIFHKQKKIELKKIEEIKAEKNQHIPKIKSSDSDDDIEVLDLRRTGLRNSDSITNSFNRFFSGSSFRGERNDFFNQPPHASATTVHNPWNDPFSNPWQMLNHRARRGEDSIDRLAKALRPNDDAVVEDVIDVVSAVLPPAIRLFSGIIRRANEARRNNY